MRIGLPFSLQLAASGIWVLLAAGCSGSPGNHQERNFMTAQVTEGPAIPISTASHAGGLVDGKPVVAGGSHWSDDRTTKRWLHECFVFRDNQWMPAPSLPQPMSDGAYAFNARGLFIAGGTDGKNPSNQFLQLAAESGALKWTARTPLHEPVEAASAAIIADTFYVAGGFSQGKSGNRLWAIDLKDPKAQWKNLAPLPAAGRAYSALTAVENKLYLFGGFVYPPYEKEVRVFGDAYEYDPPTNSWKPLNGFDLPGYAWTATSVNNRQIMLTGRAPRVGETSSEILLLNLDTLDVKSIGHLVLPGCCMPAIPMGQQTWWLPGGEPDTNRSRSVRTSVIKLER